MTFTMEFDESIGRITINADCRDGEEDIVRRCWMTGVHEVRLHVVFGNGARIDFEPSEAPKNKVYGP